MTSPPRRTPPKARKKGRIGGGNPLLDSADHTPPVSPQVDAEWHRPSDTDPEPASVDLRRLPEPHDVGDVIGPLSGSERSDLEVCEAAIDSLRLAFSIAGRGLQVIRDGRLYREHFATFDEYVEERWGIQRSYAHKLIRAWPLAQRLDPIAPRTVNEGQVRELLPVAARHGDDAAVTVYETIATADGVKVTASLIKGAVATLPAEFDHDDAIERIRAYLADHSPAGSASHIDAASVFAAEVNRLHTIAGRVARHVDDHPEQARKFVTELRDLADAIDKQLN
jgi:hypothetical protein